MSKETRHPLSIAVLPDTQNQLRVPLRPVACWRLGDGVFEFDHKLIGREARDDFQRFFALRDRHPGTTIALFGHADMSGSEDYNHRLGAERAQAVLGVLTGNPNLWYELFHDDREGRDALEAMLRAAGHTIDPSERGYGATTQAAVAEHIRYLNGGRALDILVDFLGSGRAALQSCSELNPVVRAPTWILDSLDESERRRLYEPNRRVVAYLFEAKVQVHYAWPCPVAGAGSGECRKRFWSDAAKRRAPPAVLRQYWPPKAKGSPVSAYEGSEELFACRFYERLARHGVCEVVAPWVPEPPPPPPPPPPTPEPPPKPIVPPNPAPPHGPDTPIIKKTWELVVSCAHSRWDSATLERYRMLTGPKPEVPLLQVVSPPEGDEIFVMVHPAEEGAMGTISWNEEEGIEGSKDGFRKRVIATTTSEHPFMLYADRFTSVGTYEAKATMPDGAATVNVQVFPDKRTRYDGEDLLDAIREGLGLFVGAVREIGQTFSDDFELEMLEDENSAISLEAWWQEHVGEYEGFGDYRVFFAHVMELELDPLFKVSGTIELTILQLIKRLRRFDVLRKPIDDLLDWLPDRLHAALESAKVTLVPRLSGGGYFKTTRGTPDEPLLLIGDHPGADRWEFPIDFALSISGSLDLSEALEGLTDRASVLVSTKVSGTATLGLIADMDAGDLGFYWEGKLSDVVARIVTESSVTALEFDETFTAPTAQEWERSHVYIIQGGKQR